MNPSTFKLLSDVIKSICSLGLNYVASSHSDLSCVDAGFRKLFPNSKHLYSLLRHIITAELSFGTMLHLQDSFLMNYVIFQTSPSHHAFCVIGPFMPSLPDAHTTEQVKQNNHLTIQQFGLWHSFIRELPHLPAENVLSAASRILMMDYGSQSWSVRTITSASGAESAASAEHPEFTEAQYSPFTAKLITYIQHNLDKKLDLQTLSRHTGFSETYISHTFKKEVGISPMHYITSQRIHHAQQLLTTTDKTIQEVANAVGITDWSYFAKLFRQYTGMTPTQYRNEKSMH